MTHPRGAADFLSLLYLSLHSFAGVSLGTLVVCVCEMHVMCVCVFTCAGSVRFIVFFS